LTMQDTLTAIPKLIQFFIVTAVVVSIASALSGMTYFQGAFAFDQAQKALMFMDYAGMFLTVGFFIVGVGLAALVPSNRAYLPISFIFLVVSILISAVMADTWVALVSTGPLQSAASSLPLINLVASNMPVVIGVMGLVVMIATYTSLGGGSRAAR